MLTPRVGLTPSFSRQFKKDRKKLREEESVLVDEALRLLIRQAELPERYRDKRLKGNLNACRECHPGPDLIVIYLRKDSEIIFVRVGSHAELYG